LDGWEGGDVPKSGKQDFGGLIDLPSRPAKIAFVKKTLFILNAALALPFGLICLLFPMAVFTGFGLTLDEAGRLVARGYAVTCIAYGAIFWLSRDVTDKGFSRSLLIGSILFNILEVLIQTPPALSGSVSPAIWVTIIAHATVGALSVVQFLKSPKA